MLRPLLSAALVTFALLGCKSTTEPATPLANAGGYWTVSIGTMSGSGESADVSCTFSPNSTLLLSQDPFGFLSGSFASDTLECEDAATGLEQTFAGYGTDGVYGQLRSGSVVYLNLGWSRWVVEGDLSGDRIEGTMVLDADLVGDTARETLSGSFVAVR